MRICIIGDGVVALSCAYHGVRAGMGVTVVGSRARGHEGFAGEIPPLDPIVRAGDRALVALLHETGALRACRWRPSTMGVFAWDEDRYVSDASPSRVEPLAGIRSRRTRLALWRLRCRAPLRSVEFTGDWLARRCGGDAFRRVAAPLISAIGDDTLLGVPVASAQLLVRRAFESANARVASFAWEAGSLLSYLERWLEDAGVRFLRSSELLEIRPDRRDRAQLAFSHGDERFDAVIPACAPVVWRELIRDAPALRGPEFGGPVRNVIRVTATLSPGIRLPFDQTLGFGTKEWCFSRIDQSPAGPDSGRRRVFLTHRCPPHARAFHAPDDVWVETARRALGAVGGEEVGAGVEQMHVVRGMCRDAPLANPSLTGVLPARLETLPLYLGASFRHPIRPDSAESGVLAVRETIGALGSLARQRPSSVTSEVRQSRTLRRPFGAPEGLVVAEVG